MEKRCKGRYKKKHSRHQIGDGVFKKKVASLWPVLKHNFYATKRINSYAPR